MRPSSSDKSTGWNVSPSFEAGDIISVVSSSVKGVETDGGKKDHDPHQDPLTKRTLFWIFICIVGPNALLIGMFSTMGRGEQVYNTVADKSVRGDLLIFMSTVVAAVMLVFDWWKLPNIFRIPGFCVPALLFYAGAVCKGRKYPWAGIICTLVAIPFLLGLLHVGWLSRLKRNKFYGSVAALSLFCALGIGFSFWYSYYVAPKYKWNQETRIRLAKDFDKVYEHVYSERALIYEQDCGDNKNTTMLDNLPRDEKADIDIACKQAGTVIFLSFWCPLIAICTNAVISIFCHATGASIANVGALQRTLTRFVLCIAFLLAGMYATATMSATSVRLGSTMLAFFVAALALLCIWVFLEVDHDELAEVAAHSRLVRQLAALTHNHWMQAIGLGAVAIPLVAFLVLNFATQRVRQYRRLTNDEGAAFTPTGSKVVAYLGSWNLTSVFLKITILMELFFTLQVGVMKATYIFLSWLNGLLSDTSFFMLCGFVYLIGATMFLLPPVPGLPVYLFAGIVLGEAGRRTPSVGFWGAIFVASLVCIFTKLCACVGQYLIGYGLGKSLKVQQLIGVDKVPTRAIEKVLKTRGLNIGKVAILVGGPDWPTSVTCGIIGVNIPQMLLGTLPVLFLLIPCILAGACMGRVKPGEESSWNMLANVSTGIAAVVNMVSMAYAVYTISQTIHAHGDELAKPRREHEAIAELTRREQAYVDAYARVTDWNNLRCFWRVTLVLAASGTYFANLIFVVFAEICFRPFAVSSKIGDSYNDNGLKNNAFNIIIAPVGHFALGLFAFSGALHFFFSKRMQERARFSLSNSNKDKEADDAVAEGKTARAREALHRLRTGSAVSLEESSTQVRQYSQESI